MKLGISSCLLGNNVRYDGGHCRDKLIVDVLSEHFQLSAFCPESIIFPTPRDAIRLVRDKNNIKVKSSNTNIDVTEKIVNVSKELVEKIQEDQLCGFVLKSKSPTCGLERVKVYPEGTGMSENVGIGVFAKQLKEKYPLLPIEEEGRLNDPWLRENFLMQIFAYKDFFNFFKSQPSFNQLVDFHTSYKYLIYSKSHKLYKDLGHIVANHEKKSIEDVLKEYKIKFLEAIYEKGTISNTYNVLLHIFGYFKKLITKDEKQEILAALEEFKTGIIPLIAVIKIIKLYVKRFDIKYLEKQVFLNPYPKELALRSTTKAFK